MPNPWIFLLWIIPAIWYAVVIFGLKQKVEWVSSAIVCVVIILIGWGCQEASIHSQISDHEIWNGRVTGKHRDTVSCEHSYSCNCRQVTSGSGKNQTTSTVCDTCYEHSHDYSWRLDTSLEEAITIDRVDRQGTTVPLRWTQAAINDPVAIRHSYNNYIQAVPESLFNVMKGDYTALETTVPPYPDGIYDYHYLDRVFSDGVPLGDGRAWSRALAMELEYLGPQKQANVVVIFTKSADPAYAYAVRHKWQGAKKNDIVIVIGCPQYPQVAWVKVFALCDNSLFQVQLESDLKDMTISTPQAFMETLRRNVMVNFKRKPMKDFEYLKAQIKMPAWIMLMSVILSIVTAVISTAILNNWDIKNPFQYGRRNSRYIRRW